MQSQSATQDVIRKSSSSVIPAPEDAHIDTRQRAFVDSDRITQVSDKLVQLPIVNIVYRGLKNWQSEFSPRVYDNRRRSVQPAAKNVNRGGFGTHFP